MVFKQQNLQRPMQFNVLADKRMSRMTVFVSFIEKNDQMSNPFSVGLYARISNFSILILQLPFGRFFGFYVPLY